MRNIFKTMFFKRLRQNYIGENVQTATTIKELFCSVKRNISTQLYLLSTYLEPSPLLEVILIKIKPKNIIWIKFI